MGSLILSVGLLAPQAIAQTNSSPSETDAAIVPVQSQQILFVDPVNGDDATGNGSTQRSAFRTITHALEVAESSTVIMLAPGTYSAATGEVFPLVLQPGITLQGDPTAFAQDILIEGSGSFTSPSLGVQRVTILATDPASLARVTVTNPNSEGHALWLESSVKSELPPEPQTESQAPPEPVEDPIAPTSQLPSAETFPAPDLASALQPASSRESDVALASEFLEPEPLGLVDRPLQFNLLASTAPPLVVATSDEAQAIEIPVSPPDSNSTLPRLSIAAPPAEFAVPSVATPEALQEPVDIPVPPPLSHQISLPPNLVAQSAVPTETASTTLPSLDILPVPDSNIPLGNVGDMPTVAADRTSLAYGLVPDDRAVALGLNYRVIVLADDRTEEQIKSLVPDAFRTEIDGQRVMQVGAYAERDNAQEIADALSRYGIRAIVQAIE